MRQSLYIGKEPNFQKIIVTSAVLHLMFITLATVPLKTREREYKTFFVNIAGPMEVRKTVEAPPLRRKVPPKTVTKKTAPAEKAPVTKKAAPPKRTAPEKGVSLEPEKSAERVSREIERLRAITELSKKIQMGKQAEARSKEADKEIAQAIEIIRKSKYETSRVASIGIPGVQTSMDSDSYYALVTQEIWSEWIYPDFDASGLETIISIKIGKDGKVISQEIEKSSGNIIFDRSAAKAISKASPLPPPPVEMEIGVRFYL